MQRSRVAFLVSIIPALTLGSMVGGDEKEGSPTLAQLERNLKSDDVEVRRAAALAIGRLDVEAKKQALPALIDRIANDKDPQVRLPVLESLTALGPDAAPAVPVLAKAVRTEFGGQWAEEQHGRFRAAWALGAIGEPAVEGLRPLLKEERSRVRGAAAMALGRIGPPAAAAVADLTPLLVDGDEDVRREAVQALGHIGLPAMESLVAACSDSDAQARAGAIAALGRIDDAGQRARVAVLEHAGDQAPEVQAAVISAAAALNAADDEILPVLRDAIRSEHEEVRLAAINVLVADRKLLSATAPELERLLSSDDAHVSRHAAFLLQHIGLDAAPALVRALGDERTRVEQIADALAAIGPPVVDFLTAELDHENHRLRSGAVLALGRVRPVAPATITTLVESLRDSSRDVQLAVLDSLGRIGPQAESSVDALRERLRDEAADVRVHAIEALFKIGPRDERLLEACVSLLGDGEPLVRRRAIELTGRLGPLGRRALPMVITRLSDPDLSVQLAAAEMIRGHGRHAGEAVPSLTALLGAPDPKVRSAAAETLGRIGSAAQGASPALASLLADESAEVRASAALALGGLELEAEEARPHLARALQDGEFLVRAAAIRATRRFGRRGTIFLPDLILLAGSEPDRQRLGEALRRYERYGPDPRSVPELIALLDHEREAVRLKAIEFLGLAKADAKEAIPHLERLLQDPNERILEQARTALEQIQTALSSGETATDSASERRPE